MTAPRDAISHSQFDDETRGMLLAVYDRLQRDYGIDEERAIAVVDAYWSSPTRANGRTSSFCKRQRRQHHSADSASGADGLLGFRIQG